MPYQKLIILLLALFSFLIAVEAFAWQGKVGHVADGDTITVLRNKEQIKIRLYGIDTPEKGQNFGTKAKQFTSGMAGNERVEIDALDEDQYGRTVALVYIEGDGECLNEELVCAGYAWVYERYCHIQDCDQWQKLERRARGTRPKLLRLWESTGSHFGES